MRFLRHDGIYRSDVSFILVNPAQMPPPVGRPRCRAIARDGRSTPCPSSAMSSGRLFLDRVGRHQSPSPLRRHPQNKALAFRRANKYHRTAGSVLTVCVSPGDKRRDSRQPEDIEWQSVTQADCRRIPCLSDGNRRSRHSWCDQEVHGCKNLLDVSAQLIELAAGRHIRRSLDAGETLDSFSNGRLILFGRLCDPFRVEGVCLRAVQPRIELIKRDAR